MRPVQFHHPVESFVPSTEPAPALDIARADEDRSRFTRREGSIHLNGIDALARLPIDQIRADARNGLRSGLFISGYRGSPLGGLDQVLWSQQQALREHSVFFSDGINEDLAATAVWGTQMLHTVGKAKYDGVLGMWYGKAPGVDRSGDVLKHGNYTGIQRNGGVLAITGDDPSCKSSSLPSQSESMLYHVGMPSLYPADPQEILDFGLHGYALSRAAGLWIGMKIVTNVADGSGHAEVAPERITPRIPVFEFDGQPFQPQMNLGMNVRLEALEMERTLYNARQQMARLYARANRLNHIVLPNPRAWLGIVCAGKTYRDVRQALLELGLDEAALQRYGVRLLKIGMLFPLEPTIVREFADGLEELFVIEEKRPFLELFAKDILYGGANAPRIVGKYDEQQRPLLPFHGEFETDVIARALVARLSRRTKIEAAEAWVRRRDELQRQQLPATTVRTPWYCSGCPHNVSTVAPKDSLVAAGIGCHTMSMWMNRNVVMGTHMGAEGAQWVGMAPFTETKHIFQNMGDGTYFHSGRLAIKYAAAANANITFKLLFNAHVSMTGGQLAMGTLPIADVIAELLATGVKKILLTTDDIERYAGVRLAGDTEVWHRDRMIEAQQLLASIAGTTVLLHDQECAAELRRLRGKGQRPVRATRVLINERVCEGCGDCGAKSNCMSVEPVATEFGRKTRIQQSSCNQDYSCVKGFCPAFVSVTPAPEHQAAKKSRRLPPLQRELPEPSRKARADNFECHIMGIGGTGTITVAQIIADAARLEQRYVYGLDQTGLAQKGGAVVSDVKICAQPFPGANKVSDGCADLYLGFDILTATDPKNLAKCDPERTVAIISTSAVPTGFMVADRNRQFPDLKTLRDGIDGVTRSGDNRMLDALQLAEALFGDTMAANLLLVGVAYQCGALPLQAESIERAIRDTGVAVAMNELAFRWGRLTALDSDYVHEQIERQANDGRGVQTAAALSAEAQAIIEAADASGAVLELLRVRVPELIAYQDANYARRYTALIGRVLLAERRSAPGSTALSAAVARYLYKLMAYKDEYEVSRLHSDPAFLAGLEREFKPGYTLQYHLAPPLLARRDPISGELQKRPYGGWMLRGFRLLAKLKFLRGTALDPFGRSAERRHERRLVEDYLAVVDELCRRLTPANHALAVEIAELPDLIRGYGHVKAAAIAAAEQRQRDLLGQFRQAESRLLATVA